MGVDKAIFTPIKSKRAFEDVSYKIKTLIFEGVLKPGDKLPSEAELSKQFSVGRQTVREALRILELSGFISVKKGFGGGPIVKDKISTKISGLYLDAFQMEKISVEEFNVARLAIEKAILNSAIDNLEEKDITNLQENLSRAKDIIAKKELATDVNFEFHSLLAEASKNNVLIILERTINRIMYNLRSQKAPDLKTSKRAIKAHEEIIKALINRDRKRAIDLLEKHLITVGKSL